MVRTSSDPRSGSFGALDTSRIITTRPDQRFVGGGGELAPGARQSGRSSSCPRETAGIPSLAASARRRVSSMSGISAFKSPSRRQGAKSRPGSFLTISKFAQANHRHRRGLGQRLVSPPHEIFSTSARNRKQVVSLSTRRTYSGFAVSERRDRPGCADTRGNARPQDTRYG